MWVYVGVYAHTHTHCTGGVLGCEPRSRDETPGELEESKSTNFESAVYVQTVQVHKVHLSIYMLGFGL